LIKIVLAVMGVAALLAAAPAQASAQQASAPRAQAPQKHRPPKRHPDEHYRTLCHTAHARASWVYASNGVAVHADSWLGDELCIREAQHGPNLTVTRNFPANRWDGVLAFPSILYGYSFGIGSKGSGLPAPLSMHPDPVVTLDTVGWTRGGWNKAIDVDLDRRPLKSGQNEYELMVWTAEHNDGDWAQFRTVRIDGAEWYFDAWVTPHSSIEAASMRAMTGMTSSGPLIIFDRVHPVRDATVSLGPFIRYAQRIGWLPRSGLYLDEIDGGFEIRSTTPGLEVSGFRVRL